MPPALMSRIWQGAARLASTPALERRAQRAGVLGLMRWRKKARCSLEKALSRRSTFQIYLVLPQILPSSRVLSPL